MIIGSFVGDLFAASFARCGAELWGSVVGVFVLRRLMENVLLANEKCPSGEFGKGIVKCL